jgi:urease accessory protein
VACRNPDGSTRLPVLASQAPLVLRACGDVVRLVAAAGGPLGGDELCLDIEVGDGARLELRTVAASVVQPDRVGHESTVTFRARVGAGGHLAFLPEPTVICAGARHRTRTYVSLAPSASLVLREELVLGREDERGGRVDALLHVDRGGRALLRATLDLDGTDVSTAGPAVLGGARTVGSLLTVDPSWVDPTLRPPPWCHPDAAALDLEGPGRLVTALAADTVALHRLLSG